MERRSEHDTFMTFLKRNEFA